MPWARGNIQAKDLMAGIQVPAVSRWPQRPAAVVRPDGEALIGRVDGADLGGTAEQLPDHRRMNMLSCQAGGQIDPLYRGWAPGRP